MPCNLTGAFDFQRLRWWRNWRLVLRQVAFVLYVAFERRAAALGFQCLYQNLTQKCLQIMRAAKIIFVWSVRYDSLQNY